MEPHKYDLLVGELRQNYKQTAWPAVKLATNRALTQQTVVPTV